MRKQRGKIVISIILAFILLLSCETMLCYADEVDQKTQFKLVLGEGYEELTVDPGTTTNVKIPIENRSLQVMTSFSMDVSVGKASGTGDVEGFSIKNMELRRDDAVSAVHSIGLGPVTYLYFDLTAKDTVGIGRYYFNVSFVSTIGDYTCNTLKVPFHVSKELKKAEITVDKYTYSKEKAIVGNSLTLQLRAKNEGQMAALNTYVSLDYGETGILADYTTKTIRLGDLKATASESIKIPVKISQTATAGTKTIKATFTYKDADGNSSESTAELYITVGTNAQAPKLEISGVKYSRELKRGKEFAVSMQLENKGKSVATDIKVTVDGVGTDSVLPNYTMDSISAKELAVTEKETIKVPLIVSKTASEGAKTLTITVTYKDTDDVEYSTKTTIYPEVIVPEKKEKEEKEEKKPNVIIKNVRQMPASPVAGGEVTLSFDLVNKSKVAVKQLKIGPTNLAAKTFSPVTSEPYQYVGKLDGNSVKSFEMTFNISKEIAEGLNTIEMSYSYVYGKKATEGTGTAVLNIVDVINEEEEGITIPKLIISNYYSDEEELKAGSTFTFHYDIKNTSASTSAKNIKVTVSQADNIFSITKGSNSFYIDKITAGDVYEASIELKVKADATTKAYPLDITLEYEYEGATANPTTGEIGQTVKNSINLQAIENTRPVIDNIGIADWTAPVVGEATTLNMEFYNMGKSQLNNVYVTVSGDFEKQDGERYFIGNVLSGESEFVEINVVPLVEGTGNGVVTVTFEDSNGEEQTKTKEFSVEGIQPAFTPGDMPGGMDDPGMIDPVEPEAKKALLPMWLFILIQVAILLIITPITRKVIISRYKKRLEREESAE